MNEGLPPQDPQPETVTPSRSARWRWRLVWTVVLGVTVALAYVGWILLENLLFL